MSPFFFFRILPALLLTQFCAPAFSARIEPKHQSCKENSDCSLITIGCGCIHNSTCARPEDKANGFIDSVHKNFSAQYKNLADCTRAETKTCATAGACARRGEWIPACEKLVCTPVFKPN